MPPAPNEDVFSRIQQLSQPCVSLPEINSSELLLNAEEAIGILDQEMPQAVAFPVLVNGSTSEIQGFNNSNQGAQGSRYAHSSSEQLISRAASSGGVHPPNNLYGGSTTVNGSAGTSFPNNSIGQNPQTRFPFFSDPFDYELEKLRREEVHVNKNFGEKTSKLMDELKRKMDEVRSEYDMKLQEVDAVYNAKAKEEEANVRLVGMSSLLAKAFASKCTAQSAATDVAAVRAARSFQHPIQQQQEAQIPNPSGTVLHSPRFIVTQPRPISQQNTHMNSTTPPRPPVPAAQAPIPNPSGPLFHNARHATTQQGPLSQQAAVQTNAHMNSTTPPRPSVTAAEAPIPNPSGPLSHFPCSTTSQPRPISRQAAVQSNTLVNSTATRPPATMAETPIPNPPGPSRFPTQPRPTSQQAAIQTNTMPPPRPSVTAAKPPNPNPSPRHNRTEPRQIPQQASVQTNTPLPRPSVTAAEEALPLPSPLSNTPQPKGPPVISSLNGSSYTPISSPPVRFRAPHMRSSRPPNSNEGK